jgi:hypothetical protein
LREDATLDSASDARAHRRVKSMAAIPLPVPSPPKPHATLASLLARAFVALLNSYGAAFKGLADYDRKSTRAGQ